MGWERVSIVGTTTTSTTRLEIQISQTNTFFSSVGHRHIFVRFSSLFHRQTLGTSISTSRTSTRVLPLVVLSSTTSSSRIRSKFPQHSFTSESGTYHNKGNTVTGTGRCSDSTVERVIKR